MTHRKRIAWLRRRLCRGWLTRRIPILWIVCVALLPLEVQWMLRAAGLVLSYRLAWRRSPGIGVLTPLESTDARSNQAADGFVQRGAMMKQRRQ